MQDLSSKGDRTPQHDSERLKPYSAIEFEDRTSLTTKTRIKIPVP